MDYRMPLKLHTVLDFTGFSCRIESVVGQGANAIVYRGWYQDTLHPSLRHDVLIKELFPFHPQQKIWRREDGSIVVEPEAEAHWLAHKESFESGNAVHLRLLQDYPELMTMGANLNSFQKNGTLYTILGYSGGRSLGTELNAPCESLRQVSVRMMHLLDALEVFHKSGYLHLDISPDNVMLVGQNERERIFLIDYNSTRKIDSGSTDWLSYRAGYSAPEVSTGNLRALSFASDLYSVAAVFFRCLMGRSLSLSDTLKSKAPEARESVLLKDMPQTVSAMVSQILKKGLHTVPKLRYQSIGQMRQAFQELIDRIDCVGVTHWALWETGRNSVEELIRINPSLGYLKKETELYPLYPEQDESISLERYMESLISSTGKSELLLAQGGMGKTTMLLHIALHHGKRYSPGKPAVFYISLNGWDHKDPCYVRNQMLHRLRFKQGENTYDNALHALHQLLNQPLKTKSGDIPALLLLLDGVNEIHGDITPLLQEINTLSAMAGVRIVAASRSAVPELNLHTTRLLPLQESDVAEALGKKGVLLPQSTQMMELLCTPLILSIYIAASSAGKQVDVRTKEELMGAYMTALLEKELRHLPEDSPKRWQTDAALNFVLPAIAAAAKRNGQSLTEQQLMAAISRCWNSLDSSEFRKRFPQWIGHSKEIRGEAVSTEEWYGMIIHHLLWKQMGMLMKDGTGRYCLFHQLLEEYLAAFHVPLYRREKRAVILTAIVLSISLLVGYRQYSAGQQFRTAAEEEIRDVLELGAAGYMECGSLYRQLRELVDCGRQNETINFQSMYDLTLSALESERERTSSEETEKLRVEQSRQYDQLGIRLGQTESAYEYTIVSDLVNSPDDRADFYCEVLPVLRKWVESDAIRAKNPDFADKLSDLLEADAALLSEMYHRAVAVHLSGKDTVWSGNINALIAMIPELDSHRETSVQEDRGQRLHTLNTDYLKKKADFEAEFSKLKAYARNP